MRYIRKATDRGTANFGWLDSKHSFSFGRYYDAEHMGISVLRVINDDIVAPGRGFDTHRHQNMEIISYVIEGALEHKDSTGNVYTVPAGDVQRMSAGTGIAHSEYNPSDTAPVNFLQIWILPAKEGIAPDYEQKTIRQSDKLTALVTPDARSGSLSMNQDASMYRLQLTAGEDIKLQTQQRQGYLHIVQGQLDLDGNHYAQGDGIGVYQNDELHVTAQSDIEALWFDLPQL